MVPGRSIRLMCTYQEVKAQNGGLAADVVLALACAPYVGPLATRSTFSREYE